MTESEPLLDQPIDGKTPCVFLNGDDFYVETIALSPGLSSKDLESACEMHFESSSPFHLDQMGWGCFFSSVTSQAILYAVPEDKVSGEQDSLPVFPSFVPFLQVRASKPEIVACINGRCLTLLVFDQADSLATEVHTVVCESDEITNAMVSEIVADLLRELPVGKQSFEGSILRLKHVELNWKQQLCFCLEDAQGTEDLYLLSGKALGRADVRDFSVKRTSSRALLLDQILWFSTLGCVGALVLIALGAVVNLWSGRTIQAKQALVDAQADQVVAIEGKARSLSVFESGSSATLQPLAMLELINRVRPTQLFFTEVKAYEGRKLQIEGVAESQGTLLVNQFKNGIEQIDLVRSASIEITRISDGATFFKLECEFNDMELLRVGGHQ